MTKNCSGDADTEIVKTAITQSRENLNPVLVVSDDTDIAVLLLYHWQNDMSDIFLLQERTKQWWSIKKSQFGIKEVKEHLLFLHAWSGCDSCSSTFGKGKGHIVKVLKSSSELQVVSKVFLNPQSTQNQIGNASTTAFRIVYGRSQNETLPQIRYHICI